MNEYLILKKSQINMFRDVPLYHKTKGDSYSLYKKSGEVLEEDRLEESKYPELYIFKADKEKAVQEIFRAMNRKLSSQCLAKDLKGVRETLSLIAIEVFENQGKETVACLPDTIEVMFQEFSQDSQLLKALININRISNVVVDHTVNVLILVLRYCFFHQIPEDQARKLALCAILHDIGMSMIDPGVIGADHKLSDDEFEQYKKHTVLGHGQLKKLGGKIKDIAVVAKDHHERIDGSGYPEGKSEISEESRLIGLIDSYEPLTYRDRTYRRAKVPYESLSIIKEEVLKGRFERELFRKLCASMGE